MLSLRNQVLRQEGVNSVPDKGGKGGYVNFPLARRARDGVLARTDSPLQRETKRGFYASFLCYEG